eukprot:TRINITY_DN34214_c0_g1_i1.p1 TRINITY_DN34214_c0_g1~~TRINITY_DN34214_c0_g1_i1.p1  ORF type:complete len:483 (+),score=44.83 TRINITY_DN34214_c0_g1_i1:61-1509(+)
MEMISYEDVLSVHSVEDAQGGDGSNTTDYSANLDALDEAGEVPPKPVKKVLNPLRRHARNGTVVQVEPLPTERLDEVKVTTAIEPTEPQSYKKRILTTTVHSSLPVILHTIAVVFLFEAKPNVGYLATYAITTTTFLICVGYLVHYNLSKPSTVYNVNTTQQAQHAMDSGSACCEDTPCPTSDEETGTMSMRPVSPPDESCSDDISSDGDRAVRTPLWAAHVRQSKIKRAPFEVKRSSLVCTGLNYKKLADLSKVSVEQLQVQTSFLLQQVVDAVNKHHGMMHTVFGEKFFYSFNTYRPTYSHQQSAASVALQFANISGPKNAADISITLNSSVVCGQLVCGTVGFDANRHFAALGPCCRQVSTLQNLSVSLNASVLVDGNIYKSCIGCFLFRVVDSVIFAECDAVPELIYGLLASKATNSKEWMYYEKTPYDEGVAALITADFSSALTSFQTIPTTEVDEVTLRMKDFAENHRAPPYSILI